MVKTGLQTENKIIMTSVEFYQYKKYDLFQKHWEEHPEQLKNEKLVEEVIEDWIKFETLMRRINKRKRIDDNGINSKSSRGHLGITIIIINR